jgi:predicted secreted protein
MATIVNGRSINVYQYDSGTGLSTPFAYMNSATLSLESSVKEVTSASSAFYKQFKPDQISWNISGGGFIILNNQYNYFYLASCIANRTAFSVQFVVDNGGLLGLSIFSGSVILTSYQIQASDDNLATYSVQLQGTGAYSTSGTVITPGGQTIISGTTMQVFQKVASGGETSLTFTGANGLTCLYASRGGVDAQPLAYSGSPANPNGMVWTTSSGVITLPTANPALAGEYFLILAQ